MITAMRWKAIVFDVDDTLVATREVGLEKLMRAAESLALAHPDEKRFRSLYGTVPFDVCLAQLFAVEDVERVAVAYENVNITHRPFVTLREWIPRLRTRGYLLGILTNGPARKTIAKLASAGARAQDFDVVVSLGDSPVRKPEKEAFDACIEALRLDPADVVYVGDSVLDACTALNAGVSFVAVLTGQGTREGFKAAGIPSSDIYGDINFFLASLEEVAQ